MLGGGANIDPEGRKYCPQCCVLRTPPKGGEQNIRATLWRFNILPGLEQLELAWRVARNISLRIDQ
jgi:hypothetical protein